MKPLAHGLLVSTKTTMTITQNFISEDRLVDSLGESLKAITLSNDIVDWLKKALKEGNEKQEK